MSMHRGGRNRAKEKVWPGQDAAVVRAEKHVAVVQMEEHSEVARLRCLGSPQTEDAGSSPASDAIELGWVPSSPEQISAARAKAQGTEEIYISKLVLPSEFKRDKYFGGSWLDYRRHWNSEDLQLLAAAASLGISPHAAANTIGRPPETLAHRALKDGLRIPRAWISLIRHKQAQKLNLQYPYIIKPTAQHDDLIAVNRMVSQAIPGREDVCQDIMLALYETRTSLSELRKDPRALNAFIRSFRRASFERSGYGVESMDVTLHSDDQNGKSKYEDAAYQHSLADPDDEYLEDIADRKILGRGRSTHDFSDRTIAALSNEEETLGVPAAFWARAEVR